MLTHSHPANEILPKQIPCYDGASVKRIKRWWRKQTASSFPPSENGSADEHKQQCIFNAQKKKEAKKLYRSIFDCVKTWTPWCVYLWNWSFWYAFVTKWMILQQKIDRVSVCFHSCHPSGSRLFIIIIIFIIIVIVIILNTISRALGNVQNLSLLFALCVRYVFI